MLGYLIKASLFLAFSHLFFRLFFFHTTDFRLKRIFLLSTVVISVILPLFSFRVTKEINLSLFTIDLEPVTAKVFAPPTLKAISYSLQQLVLIIYIIGATILLIRFFLKLFQLWLLYVRNERQHLQGFTLVRLKKELSPFTFFHILFVPYEMGEDKSAGALKAHEMSHARELHSLDLICYELTGIIMWFHPSVWQLRKQCLLNHEYLADASVMKKGYAMSDYRLALVDAAIRFRGVVLGNSFNQSEIIKRLKMLLNYNSSSRRKRGVIFLFSFIAVVAGLFFFVNACDNTEKKGADLPANKTANQAVFPVDSMPSYHGQDLSSSIRSFISSELKYPEIAEKNKVSGRVWVQFIINTEGDIQEAVVLRNDTRSSKENLIDDALKQSMDALAQESIRVVNSMTGFTPGIKDGKPVPVQFTIPILYSLK